MLNERFRKKLRDFSLELSELGRFAETGFVWHFLHNDFLTDILPEQTRNTSPFCSGVKHMPCRKLRKCIQFHHEEAFQTMRLLPEPRILICHAGVKVLAVPLTVSGELTGVLFTTPFPGNTLPRYPVLFGAFEALPRISDGKLMRLGAYLSFRIEREFSGEPFPEPSRSIQTQLSFSDPRIGAAAHHMRLHCRERLTAAETARVACLSVSRFLHLFREQTGYSFSDWLQRLRLSEAKRLLETSDLTLAAIAELCGISDQSRMSVLFRRYLNVTPGAIRNAQHNPPVLRKNMQ